MSSPQIFTTEIFFENQESKLWPRRLLHVPTMTSIEREGDNTYMGIAEPAYNILSYTWGRYEVTHGPALPINNVDWKIPPINPARFTVEDFHKTLLAVSRGTSFVWLDVACIDQTNYAIKMDEIGRQAGIFYNAKDAFIWLHGSSVPYLQEIFNRFFHLVARLDGEAVHEITFDDGTTITNNWEPDDGDSDIFVGENNFMPHCVKDPNWILDISSCLSELIGDVWFSSLWTLQEASLRPDAWFLSKEGSTVPRHGYAEVALMNLVHGMGAIERYLSKAIYTNRPEVDISLDQVLPSLEALEAIVERVGLGGWENPSTLYGSARFRSCVDPLDRVYGIMQIFGLRLGAASDPSRSYTLDDLEHQFATKINAISPIMGQLFVHTEPVSFGKCWRISPNSRIRTALRSMSLMTRNLGSIRLDEHEIPKFIGSACNFQDLAHHWTAAEKNNEGWQFWGVDGAIQVIALDENDFWHAKIPERLRRIETENFELNESLSSLLVEVAGNELEILLLGQFVDPEDEEGESVTTPGSIGMLTLRVVGEGGTFWQRVGVCVWAIDENREGIDGIWRAAECKLA